MELNVYKFGGASIKDALSMKNVGEIVQSYQGDNLLIVVSAMGKTTNALEKVVDAFMKEDRSQALENAQKVMQDHIDVAQELLKNAIEVQRDINDLFVEIEWLLEDGIQDGYDYIYDQIVSLGEMCSSKIVAAYIQELSIEVAWLDARDLIATDDTYREAKVNWENTLNNCQRKVLPHIEKNQVVVTQGFIGSTSENNTTTLGREGSDYSAAIFTHCLDAVAMYIWKDVPGVLTADPSQFKDVTLIDRLSYREAIEMTYYGAKVIHPKTIKPLQNKGIPLYVRSFIKPEESGTTVTTDLGQNYPPVVVVESSQCLLHISARDFSFVAEHHLSRLFEKIAFHRLKVNMMRNTAISFSISVNQDKAKIAAFENDISDQFKLVKDMDLELITIRHYNELVVDQMKAGKVILLEEILKNTHRMVVKDVPLMIRK